MKNITIGLIFLFSSTTIALAQSYQSIGDAVQWMLPITAMGLTLMDNDSEGLKMLSQSFGATAGITYGVKYTVNRTRPNGADHSFPSGHTSASFSSATYIHRRYGYKKGRLAYLAATFVGWSRIQANKHYTTDVLVGAALGSLSGFLLTSSENVDLTTYKDRDTVGVNIKLRW